MHVHEFICLHVAMCACVYILGHNYFHAAVLFDPLFNINAEKSTTKRENRRTAPVLVVGPAFKTKLYDIHIVRVFASISRFTLQRL